MSDVSDQFELGLGFVFEDLYRYEGLARLDQVFLSHLEPMDSGAYQRLLDARNDPSKLSPKEASELIIEIAPYVEDFIGELFGIAKEIQALQARHNQLAPLLAFKRRFVQKRAISGVTKEQASSINGLALAAELDSLFGEPLTQSSFFEHVSRWLGNEVERGPGIQIAARYAAWTAFSPSGIGKHHRDILFKVPHKLDPFHLIPVEEIELVRNFEKNIPMVLANAGRRECG